MKYVKCPEIKEKRNENGVSQREIASTLNLSLGAWINYEKKTQIPADIYLLGNEKFPKIFNNQQLIKDIKVEKARWKKEIAVEIDDRVLYDIKNMMDARCITSAKLALKTRKNRSEIEEYMDKGEMKKDIYMTFHYEYPNLFPVPQKAMVL